jgi:hypothetical protein
MSNGNPGTGKGKMAAVEKKRAANNPLLLSLC